MMVTDDLEAVLGEVARLFPSLSIDSSRRYVQEILRWNDEVGLISKKDPIAACRRLLIESAEFGVVVARELPTSHVRIADVGSGAGFPGVVWRFLYPEWELVLIERREKKAVFLDHIVRHLSLPQLGVVGTDARDVSRLERYRGAFDVVATMAVGEPARTAPQIEDLLVPDGLFATTLPEDAVPPARCGSCLVLENDVHAQFGRYAVYRKRV
jgi:16S rRNA (guanine(527)-N(7))-methyltransferase RsmG